MKNYRFLLLPCLAYGVLCLWMFWQKFSFLYLMLPWNVFLAGLPLLFARRGMNFWKQGHRRKGGVFLALWLLFFPNALYMLTDTIHLSGDVFGEVNEMARYTGGPSVLYTMEPLLWVKVFLIGAGVVMGVLLGLESLRLLHRWVYKQKGWKYGLLFATGVSLLGGFGIYIGRFLRFNSWDVLRPWDLLREIGESLSLFTWQFTGMTALAIGLLFWFYCLLVENLRNH
ncbi:MAG: DUF1361 domain-containing protein [Eubacteriales bacterium]|jgi:uncharacterized membrane protein